MNVNRQYDLIIQQINILTGRRQEVTTAFLTVNTAIIALLSFLANGYSVSRIGHNLHPC